MIISMGYGVERMSLRRVVSGPGRDLFWDTSTRIDSSRK
jgi:hypothetical protein